MTEVIKKNLTREPFDENKIRESVRKAAKEANISMERANELIKLASKYGTQMAEEGGSLASQDIRKRILDEMDVQEPAVSKAWKEYEKTKSSKS